MATPTIREAVAAAKSGADPSVTTGAGTAVDDVLVCFHGRDFYTTADMNAPTGTAGTWTLQATGDNGVNSAHVKVWTRPVTVGGAQTVICGRSTVGDEENWCHVIVVTGADTATPADGAAGGNGAASTSHVAPSVSPATSDALLLCGAQSAGPAGTYTPPSGMTEQTDLKDDGNGGSGFAAGSTASLVLTASGATGTKTFTFSASTAYATASIAIKAASGVAASAPPARRRLMGALIQV